MIILLDQPFSLGDLSSATYPHAYVTVTSFNGPGQNVQVSYEYGRMDVNGSWSPTLIPTTKTVIMYGADLEPFFYSLPTDTTTPLWTQVSRLIYGELQKKDARLAGTIGEVPQDVPEQLPLPLEPVSGSTPSPTEVPAATESPDGVG